MQTRLGYASSVSAPESPSSAPEREVSVVAVVVAYNRRDLLQEALDALAAQTYPLAGVVVVDNLSDDDSEIVASQHPIGAEVLPLTRNTGGAGGSRPASRTRSARSTRSACGSWTTTRSRRRQRSKSSSGPA